jgi:D-beta-D-heptose 7-phosphate kinase/D-beta-D-heptose 1-phosphate adenosyltransferase
MRLVAVSGGFDPLHLGHVEHINRARLLGDALVVILNGDDFLLQKKGYVVQPEEERAYIIGGMRAVDMVYIHHPSKKGDMSVCEALELIHPDIFAKGGDRAPDRDPIPEVETCNRLGIQIVYGVADMDKGQYSSSSIIERVAQRGLYVEK